MSTLTVIDTQYTGDNKFSEYPLELSDFQKMLIHISEEIMYLLLLRQDLVKHFRRTPPVTPQQMVRKLILLLPRLCLHSKIQGVY